ncbi:glycoside hydrolase family 31 protein [Salegentibacter sp. F188]|uniref:Glycoside hydrolase family 31 protein n=1 Tax=Autumnicola patrickiae TaxID=3075591 RepID=A0ABU3DZ11_9FLAO|nr:TIM-barrel domain-containing protein [Salegentibacter sp. F188]MDT0688918.1 glycoside hydrolase family 31 protein [Salegentibacter sp. F188]
MKSYRVIFTIFTLLSVFFSYSQRMVGNLLSYRIQEDHVVHINGENAQFQIKFCSPTIVRFRTSWKGKFSEEKSLLVNKYNWPKVPFEVLESDETLTFKSDSLQVRILKNPLRISILDIEGSIISSDAVNSSKGGAYKLDELIGVQKSMFPEEHFFGFGERMDFLDRKGKRLRLDVGRGMGKPHIIGAYNVLEANYAPVPFFMSTKGYGIFFHTAYPSIWDMGMRNPQIYSFEAEGGELEYYFIYGPEFSKILDGYTSITGKSPLLPKFALGLHVGTYSGGTWGHEEQTSANYPVALVEQFRDLEIPIDVLHLDSTWRMFGENGGSGATTFEWRETFQNTEAMFDSLYDLNLNMVGLHVRPRFDNGNKLKLLDEARDAGHVYPEEKNPGEFVNFFNEESVDWWWENGAMRVVEEGVMFFKTDEGSAFGRKANESNKTGPQGKDIKALHNLFPVAYAKAPFEKFEQHNNMRGMNHTREGYAGIQRYPFIWAGDWPSEWQYFEPVIKAGLNIGMSGVGYWSHNMGGFEHVADPELYIRWCQFGMLSPIAHLFGMEHPNYKEPWNYGEEAQEIFKKYDRLRYSLIPYLYSYSYEMHKTGMPLMRALVLNYQDDPNVYNLSDQYLLGESLMICPVTTKGAKTRVVYLPEGKWINYWTGEKFDGQQYLNVLCPLEEMPIFVKAGAIIPTQEVVNYVGERKINQTKLDIYPEGSSYFQLYDDDGRSLEYQDGHFSTTKIESIKENGYLKVLINASEGKYNVGARNYVVKIHSEENYKKLSINGKEVEISKGEMINFKQEGILKIKPPQTNNETIEIILKR